jgi:hypothetical protein
LAIQSSFLLSEVEEPNHRDHDAAKSKTKSNEPQSAQRSQSFHPGLEQPKGKDKYQNLEKPMQALSAVKIFLLLETVTIKTEK